MIHSFTIITPTRVIQIPPLPEARLRSKRRDRVVYLLVPSRRSQLPSRPIASSSPKTASIDTRMPTIRVNHLVSTILAKSEPKPPEIPVLPPGLLLLVPKPPSNVALVRLRSVNRALVLQEHNRLEDPQVEPLDRDQGAGIGAVHLLQILAARLGARIVDQSLGLLDRDLRNGVRYRGSDGRGDHHGDQILARLEDRVVVLEGGVLVLGEELCEGRSRFQPWIRGLVGDGYGGEDEDGEDENREAEVAYELYQVLPNGLSPRIWLFHGFSEKTQIIKTQIPTDPDLETYRAGGNKKEKKSGCLGRKKMREKMEGREENGDLIWVNWGKVSLE
ncbi:hypothetical protein TorRG33x02_061280 [Trema orientale]|uniref:Uncharacterized protein n=1 Tax=Trema orientale TaxID=63057 RepID=A0A2P5FJV0_TREOI|nr:hypothetical protein TorRG33x02_061280 [Trema orientale]